MRNAAMPGNRQQIVLGEYVAEYIRVRKNCAQHCGPRNDTGPIHGTAREQIVAAKKRLSDQRARDPVSNGVHAIRSTKLEQFAD